MATKRSAKNKSKDEDYDLMVEMMSHYDMWTEDNERRLSRKNGWNDVTDAYYGILPQDWPFISRVVDPRVRTSILEKNARLLNSKLRGRLVPREGADLISAEIHNSILDYQWDNANDGGSMMIKMAVSDIDTRLYASKFALVKWCTRYDDDGNLEYDGNDMQPLDIRDCGIDPTASHIRNAKWFQHRSWMTIDELENQSDYGGQQAFKGLAEIKRKLKEKIDGKSARRDNAYVSRVKTIRGMEDRVGDDIAFPVVEVVTEYRNDKWITFSPEYKIILRNIKNPYKHGKIPVAQLRYYHIQDDPHGESEVEPVISIWRAIQATICGYMDEVILKMRPPLKIIEGAVRIETIEYGPEAQWLMDRPDAVTEAQSSGEAIKYFQTTYSALVSAHNSAMGELSQGIGGVDPFNPEKTATEVRATVQQKNVRDQKNQNDLGEFIKDIMLMWLSNNQQFLFDDDTKREHVLRIVGKDKYEKFEQAGLGDDDLMPDAQQEIEGLIDENPDITDEELAIMAEAGMGPKYPVIENPEEKDPTKQIIKKKLRVSEQGDVAELSVVPEDLDGTYDYIPDVKSMSTGFTVELAEARGRAIERFSNPQFRQQLAEEGYRPKMKELSEAELEESGLRDAGRYFEKLPEGGMNGQQPNQAVAGQFENVPGAQPNMQVPGLPTAPQAPTGQGF